jgi:HAD superfamily hydrolase (TIGR01509 family)
MSRGLFVDLDGTIADSLGVMRGVYGRLLAEHGKAGSEAEFQSLNGPPLPVVVDRLIAAHALPVTADALLLRYRTAVVEAYDQVPPIAGAPALLAAAKAAGRVVGVVTSNARMLALRWLDRTGLAARVDLVVAGDEVARGKPDPEPYRLALARGGCAAARSLAVEDSVQGAQAAAAAGLATFGLAHAPGLAWPAGVTEIAALSALLDRVAA